MLKKNNKKEKKLINEQLEKIKNENEPEMTGVKVRYDGRVYSYNVYRIPLKLLVYNKDNGRIGTRVKSHEKKVGFIDEYSDYGESIIEEFLFQSKAKRNDITLESLVKNKQMVHGIVTSDGIIVDGNRRACLLNRINKNRDEFSKKYKVDNLDFSEYFLAVILDKEISKKEIHRLETEVQMGQDEKVDYNPIEKYLKCRDLKEDGFTSQEIGQMMGESTQQINKWLRILKLMDQYLDYLNYSGIYTRLDKKEDMFITLERDLKSLKKKNCYTNWAYSKSDLAKLKKVGFDYIRAEYEGKEFRNLTKTNKNHIEGIFSDKESWEFFYEEHEKSLKNVEEKDVEEIFQENDLSDYSKVLESRDNDYSKEVDLSFKENIRKKSNIIDRKRNKHKPVELLQEAYSIIKDVDTISESFFNVKVDELTTLLITELESMKEKLKKTVTYDEKS